MFSALGRRVLMQRAQDYVGRYNPQLIGITGSWGVALTKHALAHIMSDRTTVRIAADGATSRADVALGIVGEKRQGFGWLWPLGRSRIREATHSEPKTIIVEVPVRRPGQIDDIAQSFPFSVAVVTNVHTERLAYFSNKELVAHELLSLPTSLKKDSVAVLNLDELLLASSADNIQARVIGYGHTPAADVQIRRIDPLPKNNVAIELAIEGQFIEGVISGVATRMGVHAIIGALAIVYAVTDSVDAVRAGVKKLRTFKPPAGYGNLGTMGDYAVINDSFDATPESTEADVRALGKQLGRKIAVLGDVVDLGSASATWHKTIGELAAEQADVAVFVGQAMRGAQTAALKSSHQIDAHHFESSRDVGKWLSGYLHSGDSLLVVGSREMQMENVISVRR